VLADRRVVVVVGAAAAAAAALGLLLSDHALAAVQRVSGPVPPDSADLLEAFVALSAMAVLGWLLLAVIASALAAVPGRCAPRAQWAAARIAPSALRRVVAALVLSGAVAGATPNAAAADDSGPRGVPTTSVVLTPTGTGTALHEDDFSAPDPTPRPQPAPPPEPAATGGSGPVADGTAAPTSPGQGAIPAGLGPLRPPVRTDPPGTIVVRPGDCLWSIAARHIGPRATDAQVAKEWPRWYAANTDVVGDDPHLLLPGQRLRVPDRE
jgi:nucleoid-associated protein YgaU